MLGYGVKIIVMAEEQHSTDLVRVVLLSAVQNRLVEMG